MELSPPRDTYDGFLLYQALLPVLTSSVVSLLFPNGGQSVAMDASLAERLLPYLAPAFRQIYLLGMPKTHAALSSLLLSSYGVAPIFCDKPPTCDFLVSDQKELSSGEKISCVLAFDGSFPRANRYIDHHRILLRPQKKLADVLPDFIREMTLSEGGAVLAAANGALSEADFLPRPLFALS